MKVNKIIGRFILLVVSFRYVLKTKLSANSTFADNFVLLPDIGLRHDNYIFSDFYAKLVVVANSDVDIAPSAA